MSTEGPDQVNTHVYVGWEEVTDPETGARDIFFIADSGFINGEMPKNLSNTAETSSDPQISSEGNNVYVVWMEEFIENTSYDIFVAVSNDFGLTFSTPENLSNNTGVSFIPQISSEVNNAYVVWT